MHGVTIQTETVSPLNCSNVCWSFHQVLLLFTAQSSFTLTERGVMLHKAHNRLADLLVSLMELYLIKTRKPNALFSVFVTESPYLK